MKKQLIISASAIIVIILCVFTNSEYFNLIMHSILSAEPNISSQKGENAPAFSLEDKDGNTFSHINKGYDYTVLFFYPKDNTPGCTLEAQGFTRALNQYEKAKVKAIGISGGDKKSKEEFCKQQNISVTLVSDTDYRVSKDYGVYSESDLLGKTFNGISRVTFIINKSGKIIKIIKNVSPKSHALDVLSYIKELSG